MIRRLLQHQFVNAGFWVLVGTWVMNIGNYLYHLLMGRMLGPDSYGVLEAAISLLYLLFIPLGTLSIVIVKFVATFKGKGNYGQVAALYYYLQKKMAIYGFIACIILFVFAPIIMSFLHLSSIPIFLFLLFNFYVGLFLALNRSTVQGLSNFLGFAVMNSAESLSKLLVAVGLVYIGLQAEGAFAAFAISGVIAYITAHFLIQKLNLKQEILEHKKEIFTFSFPVLIYNIALTSLYTTDIILVRHFFPGVESGYYAASSVLGKVVFFALSPLTIIMFPIISEKYARKENYSQVFFLSLLLTVIGSIVIVSAYFLIPNLMINLLFGSEYLSVASLLGYFGVFMMLYSIVTVLANFYLSIHKTKAIYVLLFAALLQPLGIFFFHQSLLQVIFVSITITFLLLLFLLLYYLYATKE